ncbi:TIM barrel protein [Nocardioides sp. GXZ039]|uniref:TIM barrel protein n=1 Tax=Nocardioides sp. GXZ039 TaxID=3136018 RepID=UPI0030F42597
MRAGADSRIAGAPVSWGVCEVPGWGRQLPADRVLAQMRALGLRATELGPEGFLPDAPAARAALLERHGLTAVGGFLPAVLHEPDHDPLPDVAAYLDLALAVGADTLVLAAATGREDYEMRPRDLDVAGWDGLLARLDLIAEHASQRGVRAVVHPHLGTLIEDADDVRRVLDHTGLGLCLDTGHLAVAGADPAAIARAHPDRIGHVHLKDVDGDLAARVRTGSLSYADAVAAGLWTALGDGVLDVPAIVAALETAGYAGWYVLEQDVMLDDGTSADPAGEVRRSLAYLRGVLTGHQGSAS